MKRFFATVLAFVLLCFAGCTVNEPPELPHEEGTLTSDMLLGTYNVSFQGDTQSGNRTVDLRLLNSRLTFAVYPDMELDSSHSFDSYDPETGKASLQWTLQNERGELAVSCKITFAEVDGKISVLGDYTVKHGDVTEEYYTIFGEMIEKL